MSLVIRRAGQPLPVLEKRAGESRCYSLNCEMLLEQHELLVAIESANSVSVDFAKSKIIDNQLEVYIKNEEYTASTPFVERPISLTCRTSQGFIQASMVLRVHKY